MTRITKHHFDQPLGAAILNRNIISLYDLLDHHPQLKKRILKHEKQHIKEYKHPIWIHHTILTELKDYATLGLNKQYQIFHASQPKQPLRDRIQNIIYLIFHGLILTPLYITTDILGRIRWHTIRKQIKQTIPKK